MPSSDKVEESSTIEDPEAFERRLADRETEVRKKSIAENTRRGYDSDWRDFTAWCEEHDAPPLPADARTLKRYFIDRQANLSKATLSRRIASISRFHKEAGHLSPTVDPTFRMVMGGLRRIKKETTTGATKALLVEDLKEILEQIDPDTPKGKRDRALLLVGFAAALRRSELVALDREDIRFTREGLVLTLRTSKTDQENKGVRSVSPAVANRQPVLFSSSKPGSRSLKYLKGRSFAGSAKTARSSRTGSIAVSSPSL